MMIELSQEAAAKITEIRHEMGEDRLAVRITMIPG